MESKPLKETSTPLPIETSRHQQASHLYLLQTDNISILPFQFSIQHWWWRACSAHSAIEIVASMELYCWPDVELDTAHADHGWWD